MDFTIKLKNNFLNFISRTNLIVQSYKLNKSFNYVWGMKRSGYRLRNKINKSKLIYLEDGFIHSYGIKRSRIPFSICFDKNGIYYKYNSDSKLFNLIHSKLSNDDFLRAKRIIKLWKQCSISKYNFSNFINPPSQKYILLIDQTFGDLSVYYGAANKDSFSRMFYFASNNWPDHKIIIKVHPDVVKSKKNGYLDKNFYSKKNVVVISELGQINKLIEFSSAVCVVTSQVGLESLIYGKEVHVFGRPFYSGLGLTIDHGIEKEYIKNKFASIEQLVFASLVNYQYYLDPRTQKYCEVEEIIDFINTNRKISRFFPDNFEGINLTPWKARQINRFLHLPKSKSVRNFVSFKNRMKNIIVWGKNKNTDKYICKVNDFISVEDGFVRSVGLGGDLYPPYSLLFDKKGIHFDGSRKSNLEDLLQNRIVKKNEIVRARKLKDLIIKLKISKYNLSFKSKRRFPINISNKNIIAVLGQVEKDNSIIYGVPNDTIPKTNYALVMQVKKDYPDAFIIYKPHPDVDAGLREKGKNEGDIKEIADFIAYETPLEDIFNNVQKVAVFTSLGGFEALIRGVSVITYGLPFYAGWGLTEDKLRNHIWAKRRTRILNLEELIFISLIEYPFYNSFRFRCPMEIEHVIDEFISTKNNKKSLEQIIFKYWGILKEKNPISRK